jgi:hypothetical protein
MSGARRPVYVFPVRIQQGWGDVQEMAGAAWALADPRLGFELLHLAPDGRASVRPDRRAEPIDPRRAGPIRFPPIQTVREPVGDGSRAVVLATWWGTTARRRDAEGGPLPGTLEPEVERVRLAHGAGSTLVVSLEEFGSDQTSHDALDEGMRQAGWGPRKRAAQLSSALGRREMARYRRAFELARAAEREDVLHLTATFCPDPRALREFPFLIPVGPFRAPDALHPLGPSARGPPKGAARVVWYASPASSPAFARLLLPALQETGSPVELAVRGGPWADPWPELGGEQVRTRMLPALSGSSWSARWRGADLRIATGSQSLVQAVELAGPLLYFNGLVQGPGETPRGFRREKLQALLRGLRRAGAPPGVLRDLENFADGRRVGPIVRRAMGSAVWRGSLSRALARLPLGLPEPRREGGRFLCETLRSFFGEEEAVPDFVRRVRTDALPARGYRTRSSAVS